MKTPRLLSLACIAACLPLSSVGRSSTSTETAVLAGGCFWGMEAVFEHVKGVRDVVSGYAGGTAATRTTTRSAASGTGHAEAVRITFDPRQVSYAQLLKIYFTVAHDPTQVNRQGPDAGPSYRSAIFPQNAAQRQLAASFISAAARRGQAHRDEDRKRAVLPGGSLSPGFRAAEPDLPVHRGQRRAEASEAEARLSAILEGLKRP